MKLNEIVESLNLAHLTPELEGKDDLDVRGGHASDLLSDVLANAPTGGVLVTIQIHMNVIAVAVHAGLAAVIFASGRGPEETVREKAIEEGIHLYVSKEATFDVAGKLYSMGLRGRHA